MSNPSLASGVCPVSAGFEFKAPDDRRDDRKSAAIARAAGGVERDRASRNLVGEDLTVRDFVGARAALRNPQARQAGFLAELVGKSALMRPPILYQHGAAHRRQRSAIARFFAPKVVTTTHRALMERAASALAAQFRAQGRANLDDLSLDMAVTIAAEIVGLTDSDRNGMARRLDALVTGVSKTRSRLAMALSFVRAQLLAMSILWRDVKPAIRARRRQRRDDVISHLLDEGYGDADILTECLTYGAAGMITTREFITMAGWRLLEDDDLRARFLSGDEAGRIVILEEILRLEPVVGMLFRRFEDEGAAAGDGRGRRVALDIREANTDEAVFGACPHSFNADRAAKAPGSGLAFGDGEHRCPGAQVALQESAIFLDHILRTPGIGLTRTPDIGWNSLIAGYELRGATITCAADA